MLTKKIQEIKREVEYQDEFHKYAIIYSDDLDWLFSQVELFERIKSELGLLILTKEFSKKEIEEIQNKWLGVV